MVDAAAKNTVATHMYQENMRYFEPVMQKFLKGEVLSNKKVEHDVSVSTIPFVWSGEKKFFIHDGKVFVPEDLPEFYAITSSELDETFTEGEVYALVYHLASMRMIDDMYQVL